MSQAQGKGADLAEIPDQGREWVRGNQLKALCAGVLGWSVPKEARTVGPGPIVV